LEDAALSAFVALSPLFSPLLYPGAPLFFPQRRKKETTPSPPPFPPSPPSPERRNSLDRSSFPPLPGEDVLYVIVLVDFLLFPFSAEMEDSDGKGVFPPSSFQLPLPVL